MNKDCAEPLFHIFELRCMNIDLFNFKQPN